MNCPRALRYTIAVASGLICALCLSFPARGQRAASFSWTCNIEGAPAQLTAQVEAINSAGVFVDASGMFAGSVSTGEVNYYYQGRLDSATAHYSYTGENAFASFTDLINNERFNVRFVIQGRNLLMIVNPHGPQPVQYGCEMSAPPR